MLGSQVHTSTLTLIYILDFKITTQRSVNIIFHCCLWVDSLSVLKASTLVYLEFILIRLQQLLILSKHQSFQGWLNVLKADCPLEMA